MRYFLPLTGMLVLAAGCTRESLTDPQNSDPYVLVVQGTIGPSGGILEADDFSIEIPPGAFAGERTVKLLAAKEIQPFGADQVTRTFRLTGIPGEFTKPLRVCIEYGRTLSEETHIAHGMQVFDEVMLDEKIIYRLIAASDSSGCLVCEIPATIGDGRRVSSGLDRPCADAVETDDALDLLGLTGYRTHATEHFSIKYPVSLVEVNIAAVGAMLEEHRAAITQTMQLSWPWSDRVQTVVQQLGAGCGACASVDFQRTSEGPALSLSRDYLSQGQLGRVRLAAGQTLLLNLLRTLDPAAMTLPNYWLRHAVAAWAEEHFTEDAAFQRPWSFRNVEMAPFHGMRAGSGTSNIDEGIFHGYGMASVIKYLADDQRFTAAGVGQTYATISEGGRSATAALLDNVDALVAEWWPQFFKSYVGGEVYSVPKSVFTHSKNLEGTWTIAGAADTVRVFTGGYPDLSAKLYMIELNNAALDQSAALTLKLSGLAGFHAPWGVMAFGAGGESLEYWGHAVAQGSATLRVSGLRGLYDAGWRQILVVAICSNTSSAYLDVNDAELTVRITSEDPSSASVYNSFDFGMRIVGHWRYVSGSFTSEYEDDLEEEPWGLVDVITGEMAAENRFVGSFAAQGATGEVSATLNAARDTLLVVQLDMRAADTAGRTWEFGFRAAEVPLWFDDDEWTIFRIMGPEACSYLEDVYYEYLDPAANESRTLLDYHCTDAGVYPSALHLALHKRPG